MSIRRTRYGLVLLTVAAFVLLAIWLIGRPAAAALGNTGVPVRGRLAGPVPQSETYYVQFTSTDGTPFADGERVPAGKYLLITDIVVTTDGGTDPAAVLSLDLMVDPSDGQSLRLRSTDNATHGLHYTTPYFVLEEGDRLKVSSAWFSDKWAYVNVSGMLVNHVTFFPLAISN